MKVVLALALFFASVTAMAGEEKIVTADQMKCKRLQAQALKYKFYWKMSPDDGPIPIYGFKTYKSMGGTGGFCGKDKGPHPIYERTLDERYCLVGYVCH